MANLQSAMPIHTLFKTLHEYHANKGTSPVVDFQILRCMIDENIVRGSAPIQSLLDNIVLVRHPLDISLIDIFALAVEPKQEAEIKDEPAAKQENEPMGVPQPPPPTVNDIVWLIDSMNAMFASYPDLSRDPSLFAKYYHLRCVLKSLLSPY